MRRQNESADFLADQGFDIEHNSVPNASGKVPDYKLRGKDCDHFNVRSGNPEQARKGISDKISEYQAERIVVRLDDSILTPDDVLGILERKPIASLKELIIIKNGQYVHRTW